jgi:hypothetical protein
MYTMERELCRCTWLISPTLPTALEPGGLVTSRTLLCVAQGAED